MTFERTLTGGHPNSLKGADSVLRAVQRDPKRLQELFGCLFSDDAIVRMRAGDAIEKVFREQPELAKGYERDIFRMAAIDQPSVQWHFAEIVGEISLTSAGHKKALTVLKRNLTASKDWIVLNVTMQVLAGFAKEDPALKRWLRPRLSKLSQDERRSVAKRAGTLLSEI